MTHDTSLSSLNEKAAYIKLFDSLAGHNLLLEANPPVFTILAATPGRLHDVGMTKEAVIGRALFDAHPGNSTDPSDNGVRNLRASLDHVLKYKEIHQLPIQRYDLPDEQGGFSEKYWRASNRPVLNDEGEVAYIIHTADDITAQVKAAHREIRMAGVEKIFSLFMHAPMVVGLVNGDDYVLEMANETAFKLWGKEPGEIIGKPILQGLPELMGQGIIELFDQVRSSGKTYTAHEVPVTSLVNGRQEQRYFNLVYQPYYDKNNAEATGVFTISHDVTPQVMARKKFEESEKRIVDILESTTDAFYALDADFNFTYVNRRAAEIWGRDRDALIGKHYWTEFPKAVGSESYHKHYQAVREGIPVHYDTVSPLIGTWIEAGIYPGSNGTLSVFFKDITERKKMEQAVRESKQQLQRKVEERTAELAAKNKELERSNQNLEEFAHAASHDLKEPVRKILFFTNQLREQLKEHLKESEIRTFGRIQNATQRMNNLIDDLLIYSYVTHRPHQTEPIDLSDKVHRVLEDLDLEIEEKKATVRVGKLPVVQGYRRQLQQLFQNLISNALKYSKAHQPPLIEITAEEVQKNGKFCHLISVRDNGIGFDPIYADKIFQMFARLHGRSEYDGTGVGLSIVKKVVENHNGYIEAESVPNEGSVFKIYLPG